MWPEEGPRRATLNARLAKWICAESGRASCVRSLMPAAATPWNLPTAPPRRVIVPAVMGARALVLMVLMVLMVAWSLLGAACAGDASAEPTPGPPPTPGSGSPGPVPGLPREPRFPGATEVPCHLRTEIEADLTADAIRLKFWLVNRGAQEERLSLPAACPGGPVELFGLGAGFDPMHTCQAGPCPQRSIVTTYTVPAGGKIVLGETTLRARGDACNKPLPPGWMHLRADIAPAPRPWNLCSGAVLSVIRDQGTGRLRRPTALDQQALASPPPPPVTAPAPPKTTPAPPKPTPAPRPQRTRPCPACGFACIHGGVPSTRRAANGCVICACDGAF
jgi:hypothetical protein